VVFTHKTRVQIPAWKAFLLVYKSKKVNIEQRNKQKQNVPGNRSRTSDLEISVVAIYSLPLCQLSYTREHVHRQAKGHSGTLRVARGMWMPRTNTKIATKKKQGDLQSVGIEPTLLRTCALSMRLNRSAKTALCATPCLLRACQLLGTV
jgi:hypothetical protein